MVGKLETLELPNLSSLKSNVSIYMARKTKDAKRITVYHMVKFSNEGTIDTTYVIRPLGATLKDAVCNCPAAIDNCRHKRMLQIFLDNEAVDDVNKIIATNGRQMMWLKIPYPLIDPDLLQQVD